MKKPDHMSELRDRVGDVVFTHLSNDTIGPGSRHHRITHDVTEVFAEELRVIARQQCDQANAREAAGARLRQDIATVLNHRRHSHSTPGQWDKDGRPCVECAARERLTAHVNGQPAPANDDAEAAQEEAQRRQERTVEAFTDSTMTPAEATAVVNAEHEPTGATRDLRDRIVETLKPGCIPARFADQIARDTAEAVMDVVYPELDKHANRAALAERQLNRVRELTDVWLEAGPNAAKWLGEAARRIRTAIGDQE